MPFIEYMPGIVYTLAYSVLKNKQKLLQIRKLSFREIKQNLFEVATASRGWNWGSNSSLPFSKAHILLCFSATHTIRLQKYHHPALPCHSG